MDLQSNHSSTWSLPKKLSLRFAFIFTVLFIFLLDWYSNAFSLGLYMSGMVDKGLNAMVLWVGENFFGIDYPILSPTPGNHSDSTYIYILYFTMIVLAILGALVWSAIDRKQKNLDLAYYWLCVIIRYYLAINLFAFGLEKFFKAQFPDLGFYQLSEPLGDMTPMSLAWAFFGYSYGYNLFMGLAESAALLLLFRRTTTFGALLTVAAMSNVVAVNISYDIHAKMFALMQLVLALFLLLPHIQRLFRFFFTGEAVALPVQQAPVYKKKWIRVTVLVFKWVVIVVHVAYLLNDYWGFYTRAQNRPNDELSGIYDVESFVVNKDTLSLDNSTRWNQFVFERGRSAVRMNRDSVVFAFTDFDEKRVFVYEDRIQLMLQVQEIYREQGSFEKMDSLLIEKQAGIVLYYDLLDATRVDFKGKFNNDSLFISAKRIPIEIKDFRLMKSKINIITEEPRMY
ncbi:hypothetical protein [Pararhodonellum marinum]|uniref:hypothetical protein n=1 Tax=Pararhodonellum marinum TaxID=2755358 RepID=UPI00189052E3|nr:hypothetical protein [Pararhodonellum marinum]